MSRVRGKSGGGESGSAGGRKGEGRRESRASCSVGSCTNNGPRSSRAGTLRDPDRNSASAPGSAEWTGCARTLHQCRLCVCVGLLNVYSVSRLAGSWQYYSDGDEVVLMNSLIYLVISCASQVPRKLWRILTLDRWTVNAVSALGYCISCLMVVLVLLWSSRLVSVSHVQCCGCM